MNVRIYSESTRANSIIGGSEFVVVILAECLARQGHAVEIVHHHPALTGEDLAQRFGVDARELRLRYIASENYVPLSRLGRRYRADRDWHRKLSEGCDLFINIAHQMPPYCHARRGMLMVLFPFYKPRDSWFAADAPSQQKSRIFQRLRLLYYRWDWRSRMRTYQLKTAISAYTQRWTKRYWDVDSHVVYPPVEANLGAAAKTDSILSIGRFSSRGVIKRQLEMMEAFRALSPSVPGWRYFSVGGVGTHAGDQAYFQRVGQTGAEHRGEALANLPRGELRRLCGEAKIFWHAAGYGDDPTANPDLAEHYGIATVEAMSAGCVPVVINRGAQPELVAHGENGFLWDTLDELQAYTSRLIADPALCQRMSAASVERARKFSRQAFEARVTALLRPLLAA